MIRRINVVGVALCGLALWRCSGPEPSTPTVSVADTAGVGLRGSDSASSATTPDAVFKTNPRADVTGSIIAQAPFVLRVNMCRSSDPDPNDVLVYTVDFGDGNKFHGKLCRAENEYLTPGTYRVTACVYDGHPDDESSRVCRNYTVEALGTSASFTPPAVGTGGTAGVLAGVPWIVCRADESTAWVAANSGGTYIAPTGGTYNAPTTCQFLGYSGVNAFGGTCGTVCGYCGSPNETYDGAGGPLPILSFTVHWRCVR